MLRLVYICLSYLLQPVIFIFLWLKGRNHPAYRKRLWERFGIYGSLAKPQAKGVMVHAASVGEVIAATPLIKAIQQQYPELAVTVTTMTPTGSERVTSAFGNSIFHLYLPYDSHNVVVRFLDFVDPKLIIVIETELWPNLIRKANHRQIPFVIANARLSARSAKRYAWFKRSIQAILNQISLIMAQDEVSRDRYIGLGASAKNTLNVGNLKFDLDVSPALAQSVAESKLKLNLEKRPIWIAGSTHEGEESLILAAHQQLLVQFPDLLLILVPRHPERFQSVEMLIAKTGLSYTKRSLKQTINSDIQVLLGDTMGEMMLLYGLSDVAFVGGSLVKVGGHNPLEPIAFKLPVISGQFTYNFPEVFEKLREVKGIVEVESHCEALVSNVTQLLTKPEIKQSIAQAGFSVLQQNQGALNRHLEQLKPYLERKNEL